MKIFVVPFYMLAKVLYQTTWIIAVNVTHKNQFAVLLPNVNLVVGGVPDLLVYIHKDYLP